MSGREREQGQDQNQDQARALIAELRRRGVQLAIDPAGRVVVQAPRGVLTAADRARLREHRDAVARLVAAEAGEGARRTFQRHWLATLARLAIRAWALPCGCVGFRCPCCGGDSATIGQDGVCTFGSAQDPRHRWMVGEYAPAGDDDGGDGGGEGEG